MDQNQDARPCLSRSRKNWSKIPHEYNISSVETGVASLRLLYQNPDTADSLQQQSTHVIQAAVLQQMRNAVIDNFF